MTSGLSKLTTRFGCLLSGVTWLGAGQCGLLAAEPVTYVLLPDSLLTDECLVCGRPTIPEPMSGRFQLRTLEDNGLYMTYAVENFTFVAGRDGMVEYAGSGTGTYRQGGEVFIGQDAFLDFTITHGLVSELASFTNSMRSVPVSFPNLQIQLAQTNGTPVHTIFLNLHAEPLVEIPLRVVVADRRQVTLAWSIKYPAVTAFRATRLGPLPDWQEVPLKSSPVGLEYQATLPAAEAVGFFRLHVP
jgi:hypothetical protein